MISFYRNIVNSEHSMVDVLRMEVLDPLKHKAVLLSLDEHPR